MKIQEVDRDLLFILFIGTFISRACEHARTHARTPSHKITRKKIHKTSFLSNINQHPHRHRHTTCPTHHTTVNISTQLQSYQHLHHEHKQCCSIWML
uniref:Uncharacterized protein n=1 Tax=Octopus bimaculoides TaxID=37653 RepID=A0A0L8FPI2_OCTBM